MSHPKAPKPCRICQLPFLSKARGARGRNQQTCGDKDCISALRREQRLGKPVPWLREAVRRRTNEKIQVLLRAEFGELSVREIELFRWAWSRAWRRGFDAGRYRRTPQEKAA